MPNQRTTNIVILIIAVGITAAATILLTAPKEPQQCTPTVPIMENGYYLGYYNDSSCKQFVAHPKLPSIESAKNLSKRQRIQQFYYDKAPEWLTKKANDASYGDFVDFMMIVPHEYNIKVDIPACIMWADSELGNNLRTRNNIGNVGNTEYGSWTPEHRAEGFIAILTTLNNSYLRDSDKVGLLSNGGKQFFYNKHIDNIGAIKWVEKRMIYASSSINWNRNVLNCLRYLNADKSINEEYNIRVQN